MPTEDVTTPFVTDAMGDAEIVVSFASLSGLGLASGDALYFQARTADAGMTGQPDGAFALSNAVVIIVE